ncbi:hypothetical protein YC2023_115906 [Brassica napus]
MFKLMVLGDGGYPSFVVAGFLPGGRGFLRSVDAGSSSREAEARLAPSSSASVSEGACYRRWLLSSDDGATVKREKKRLESRESDEISVYQMYLSVVRISGVTADPFPAEPVRQDEDSALTRVDRLGQCRSLCIGL